MSQCCCQCVAGLGESRGPACLAKLDIPPPQKKNRNRRSAIPFLACHCLPFRCCMDKGSVAYQPRLISFQWDLSYFELGGLGDFWNAKESFGVVGLFFIDFWTWCSPFGESRPLRRCLVTSASQSGPFSRFERLSGCSPQKTFFRHTPTHFSDTLRHTSTHFRHTPRHFRHSSPTHSNTLRHTSDTYFPTLWRTSDALLRHTPTHSDTLRHTSDTFRATWLTDVRTGWGGRTKPGLSGAGHWRVLGLGAAFWQKIGPKERKHQFSHHFCTKWCPKSSGNRLCTPFWQHSREKRYFPTIWCTVDPLCATLGFWNSRATAPGSLLPMGQARAANQSIQPGQRNLAPPKKKKDKKGVPEEWKLQ